SQTPKIQPKEKHKEVPRVRNKKEYLEIMYRRLQ
ncbi:30S ribosomal protein S30e, partial [Sulfolobus sp. E3]